LSESIFSAPEESSSDEGFFSGDEEFPPNPRALAFGVRG